MTLEMRGYIREKLRKRFGTAICKNCICGKHLLCDGNCICVCGEILDEKAK